MTVTCTIVSRNGELMVCFNYEFHNSFFVEFNLYDVNSNSIKVYYVKSFVNLPITCKTIFLFVQYLMEGNYNKVRKCSVNPFY